MRVGNKSIWFNNFIEIYKEFVEMYKEFVEMCDRRDLVQYQIHFSIPVSRLR